MPDNWSFQCKNVQLLKAFVFWDKRQSTTKKNYVISLKSVKIKLSFLKKSSEFVILYL